MNALELKAVKYIYKNKHQTVPAVNGIDYSFSPGTLYAIVGKSGSGKTTLLSLMAGLDLPTEGEVLFDGENIADISRDEYRLKHMSVIFQSLNLFPFLTAIENVMFPLEYRHVSQKEAKIIAMEKLKSVGLDEPFWNRLPSMLSGGEQQRVAIARALALKTEFILADEPTGNLDTQNSENIVALLMELVANDELCVIIVTHDLAVAKQADVVLTISDGKIIENSD